MHQQIPFSASGKITQIPNQIVQSTETINTRKYFLCHIQYAVCVLYLQSGRAFVFSPILCMDYTNRLPPISYGIERIQHCTLSLPLPLCLSFLLSCDCTQYIYIIYLIYYYRNRAEPRILIHIIWLCACQPNI